jgi:hypothetical protein
VRLRHPHGLAQVHRPHRMKLTVQRLGLWRAWSS